MAILVFLEQREGEIKKTSYEAVAEARRLADAGWGGDVIAVLACAPGQEAGASQAGAYGADQVWVGGDASFAKYQPEGYAALVAQAQAKAGALTVFF
ncbi:MAG: electron transfer flavoprotein subunit alpha/FixB family protein, partial [Candidatus Eisenbacteria bacterium]